MSWNNGSDLYLSLFEGIFLAQRNDMFSDDQGTSLDAPNRCMLCHILDPRMPSTARI